MNGEAADGNPGGYCSLGASARVFVRIMHEKPETAGAKMSVLCSIHDNRILHLNSIVCVHHVAVNGEAVNSNPWSGRMRERIPCAIDKGKPV